MDITEIRLLVRQGRYEFSIHAQQERLEEDLDVTQIEEASFKGTILEDYQTIRGASCLVLGYAADKPVHVQWDGREEYGRTSTGDHYGLSSQAA
jgi:hypothetical protein